jgi:glutamate synthase domain-containing protein 2
MPAWITDILIALTLLFFTVLIGLLITIVYWYWVDVRQTKHAIRRNFPVIGRFRYWFESLGEFFRQYFFAMDREEMPFNRSERAWAYRAAKNLDTTIAFGSTRKLSPGEPIFLNCPFPTLETDVAETSQLSLGEGFCDKPYTAASIINVSAMSYGAISKPAILALTKGAKMAGIWVNTGEGGLSEYHLEAGCDLVFQIGTAKYGVRDAHGKLDHEKLTHVASYPQVKMFEIKLSQGAKPGKGGILPAEKVTDEIAKIRLIPVHQASLSPNGHPEIKKPEDILNMVFEIRETTQKPVGIKFVLGAYEWLDEMFELVNVKRHKYAPDFITLDGGEGGTGAAPQSLMDYMGLPLRESLPLLVRKRKEYHLEDRIKIIASGKLINPSNVAWAICLGADFVVTARGFMFALGCIQALQCNKNTCPTGITTHNKELQKGLDPTDKSIRVMHYAKNLEKSVGIIAHSCGVKEPRQLKAHHVHIVTHSGRLASEADQKN